MLSLLATAATAVTAVMGSGTGVVDRPALLPVNHPSAWLETLATNVRDGNPEAAIEVLKERLGEHKEQAMKRPSQKTFKSKFKLQELENLNDLGSFALSDGTKTATVDGAGLDEDGDQNVYYYTISGWNADTTLEVGVSDNCTSFSTETGFFINSLNVFKEEADELEEGGSWTSMVPACVLADVGDNPVYFYITVDKDTPQCTVTLTMTETAAPCNRVAVSGEDSGSIELNSDQWLWIDYDDTLTAGQLLSFSTSSDSSFSYDAYAYSGAQLPTTVEPFAVTKDFKAKFGIMSSGDNISITYTITETPYTCADGAAIAAAATGDAAFPLCNVDYNFVGYDADPFEGLYGFLLIFLPQACYEPTVALYCADMYPPCDSNNLAKTLCSGALCNGLIACANALVPGAISGGDADAYCSSGDAGLNSYDFLGDENGTINSYPEYSSASGCAPVPLCATTCGVAALRPALMMMAFVVLNTVKNLYGN